MSITFDTLEVGGSVVLENPTDPYKPAKLLRQIVSRRDDGSFVVTRIGGDPIQDFTLSFDIYPDSEKAKLDTWIQTKSLGAGVRFTFTDHEGNAHTNMRVLVGTEDWETIGYDADAGGPLWRGTLILAKDLG